MHLARLCLHIIFPVTVSPSSRGLLLDALTIRFVNERNMSENSLVLVKISCTSLLFVVILTNFILFSDSKSISGRNFPSNANSDSRSRNEFTDENFHPRSKIEGLSGKVTSHDTCIGNCDEKNPKVLREFKHLCPYDNKELCLIFSLSKIAKVQVATSDGSFKDAKNFKSYEELGKGDETRVDFSKGNDDGSLKNFSRKQVNSTNVSCRAIQDVYIPQAKQHLPAFACKLKNNTFVLSSERFLQDRRLYLEMKMDEEIFKNTRPSPKVLRSSEYNTVPALLVLNAITNDYRIEMHQNISDERNIIHTVKDR